MRPSRDSVATFILGCAFSWCTGITARAAPAELELEDLGPVLTKILETDFTDVPALAAAAVVDGEIRAAGAAGLRKRGATDKVTLDDKFHVGSNTKSMTATLGVILDKYLTKTE